MAVALALMQATATPPPHFAAYVDVFVAGAEGSGHHGLVAGFLEPLLSRAPATCVVVDQMPERFVEGGIFGPQQFDCARDARRLATVGWESLPSQRRVQPQERVALLYGNASCLKAGGGRERIPQTWQRIGWRAATRACLRCGGDARKTFEDVTARLERSDRLALPLLAAHGARQIMGPYGPRRLRFLVIHRDFFATVASHQRWDGSPLGHAVLVAAHLALLARDLARLPHPGRTFRVLRFELLYGAESYATAAAAAARFLFGRDFAPSPADVAFARSRWRPPRNGTVERQARDVAALYAAARPAWRVLDEPGLQLLHDGRERFPVGGEAGPCEAPWCFEEEASLCEPAPRPEPCRRERASPLFKDDARPRLCEPLDEGDHYYAAE